MGNYYGLEKPIYEMYGSNTALKVKNDYFDIGKVLFTFTKTDANGKLIEYVDCSMDFLEAEIFSYALENSILANLKAGKDWESRLGGVHEEEAQKRGLRKDGYAVSRQFFVQAANKGCCRFTGVQRAGKTNEKGLIVPLKDVKEGNIAITVPIPGQEDLNKLSFAIRREIQAYRTFLYLSGWRNLQGERAKTRKDSVTETNRPAQNQGMQTKTSAPKAEPASGSNDKNFVPFSGIRQFDCWYSIKKGSSMRKTQSGNATVLRLVSPKIADGDPGILATDQRFQLVDAVFYDREIKEKGIVDEFSRTTAAIYSGADGGSVPGLKGLTYRCGGICDGFRQIIFSAKSA